MRIRSLVLVAAVAALFVGTRPLEAQQMAPYGMMGGYAPVARMGYAMPAGMYPGAPAAYSGLQPAPATPANLSDIDGVGCNECGEADCGGSCGSCGCWNHRVAVFGEFLYLRPRNAEVAYGVAINGPITAPPANNPIQVGRVGMVDYDYEPAFRFGFTYVLDGWSSFTLQYSRLEATRDDRIDTAAPNVIRSLVSHPGTLTAAQDFLTAQASQDITYDMLDADYRGVIVCRDDVVVNWLIGARYTQLQQDFDSLFVNNGTETVTSEVDFYGAGLRLGLEGEKYSHSRRWLVYGKTSASFIAGQFTADYFQGQSFDPEVVNTTWKAGRIVPMLDLELGFGWQSRCRTWRLTAGYVFSAWYNTVKTDRFIQAVRNNNFVGMSDSLTFDGLVARVEGRF